MIFSLLEGLGGIDRHIFHAVVIVRNDSGGCRDDVFFDSLLVSSFPFKSQIIFAFGLASTKHSNLAV